MQATIDTIKLTKAKRSLRVRLRKACCEHITAEVDPHSGRDVLIFPMKQTGQDRTSIGDTLGHVGLLRLCTFRRRS